MTELPAAWNWSPEDNSSNPIPPVRVADPNPDFSVGTGFVFFSSDPDPVFGSTLDPKVL